MGRPGQTKLAHILDYAAERYNEGCGKTVLDSFLASLSVLEQAGKSARGPDALKRSHLAGPASFDDSRSHFATAACQTGPHVDCGNHLVPGALRLG